jgi:hypothetical protein
VSDEEEKLKEELKKEAIKQTGIISKKKEEEDLKKIQRKIEKQEGKKKK